MSASTPTSKIAPHLWFADKAVWVADGERLLPFVAPATAKAYVARHGGARVITYADALGRAS